MLCQMVDETKNKMANTMRTKKSAMKSNRSTLIFSAAAPLKERPVPHGSNPPSRIGLSPGHLHPQAP